MKVVCQDDLLEKMMFKFHIKLVLSQPFWRVTWEGRKEGSERSLCKGSDKEFPSLDPKDSTGSKELV